jgi:hypothetical protein
LRGWRNQGFDPKRVETPRGLTVSARIWLRALVLLLQVVCLVAGVIGLLFAYSSWTELRRIRDVVTNGTNAIAHIDNGWKDTKWTVWRGFRTVPRDVTYSYYLGLSWRDVEGASRTVQFLDISHATPNEIFTADPDDRFRTVLARNTIEIKYLVNRPDVRPVIVETAGTLEAQNRESLTRGAVMAMGLVVAGFIFVLQRRQVGLWRKDRPAGPA